MRRLQRRRVPVTKVLGSNATMIPAALAWAVELKVRHIADFVDQKMDMRLVPTRPGSSATEFLTKSVDAEGLR